MASYEEIKKRVSQYGLKNQDESRDEEEKSSYTGSSAYNRIKARVKNNGLQTEGVDEDYVNKYFSDASSFVNGAHSTFGGGGYISDATKLYETNHATYEDLYSRYTNVRTWLNSNKSRLSQEDYDKYSKYLEQLREGVFSAENAYKGASDFYGQFDSEDSYNAWKSRQDILSRAESDPDFESKSSTGWSKYLSDKEARANEALYGKEDETFWDKLGRWMGSGGAVDTSLPMGTATQVQHDLREDTSPLGPTNDWTDEQKAIYGYLYETDRAAAAEYARYATEDAELNAIKKIQEDATSSFGAAVLNTAGAIAAAPLGMADFLNDLVKGDFSDDGTISPFEYSQAVTEGIATHLNEKGGTLDEDIPIIGGKGWGDVYSLGTSIAQSMASAYTLGPGGTLVSYFGQGAAAGADEAKKRGATDSQAVLYGMAVGVFEGVAESIGIDNLFKLGGTTTLKGVIKNILKQAGAEGMEEGLTALFSNIADNAIMGDKSTYYALVEQYMASGMSESEAKRKAWLDSVEGIAYDTIAGAVSGGVSGGIHTTTQSIIDNTQAKKLYGDSAMELTQEALELNQDNEFARKMYDRLDSGKTLSGAQLNRLVQENESAMVSKDAASIQSAVEERLTSLGETGDVASIANALVKQVQGESLSKTEQRTISNSKFGKRVANEMNPDNIRSGGYSSAWAEKIGTERIYPAEYGEAFTSDEKKASVTENATAHDIAVQAILEGAESIPKTAKVEENVEVKEIASVKDGEVMVRLDGGEVVNAREANLSTETEGLLYEAVAQMSADPNIRMDAVTANDFVKGYDPKAGVSVGAYIHGFKDAFLYGAYGFAETELERGVFTSRISEIQRRTAHGHGKMVGQERAAEKQAKIDSTVSIKTAKNATSGGKKGKVYRDFGSKTLNARQKQSLKALEVVADALGVDIHVFESAVDENGKRVGANGWYDPADSSIHIDLYAGASGESTMLFTAAHELTHFIREWSPAKFKTFADFLLEQYGEKGVSVEQLVQRQIEKAKRNGRDIDFDTAYEEVIADSCEAMLTDSNAIEKIAMLKAKDKGLWKKIKKFISDLVAKINEVYNGLNPDSLEANYVREMKDAAEKLQELWTDALVDAGASYQASALVEIDTDTDSVAPMFSERTWTASEYVTEREITAKKISKDLGVDIDTAYKYIDDINSVARLIADDRARLDYEPNLDSTATVIKPNSDYKWSVDMSTLCAKRLLFTGTFDALQKMFPNTAFDSDDIVRLRSMMEERGYEVACGICYVESTRREIGTITADFIERYKEAQKTGKPITRINSEGKVVELKKTKDQMDTTVDKSSDKFFTEKGYTPTLAELNTTDIDLVKKNHPLVYEAYLNFMNARGQAKPKLLETRAEYKGEILKHFKYASAVKSRNNAGGLRLQSFSDFEVPHLIDMMQITMDMARVGLKAQAYTKVPNFAEAFGNTGIKINLSLIAKGTGLDADGNLVFDDVEGINHKEAFRLREKFSENVGTILVGKNDPHIIAAMADPRIDYIIPFHKSSWKESLYDALGLTGYDDYTDTQNEKPLDKSRTIKNFDPSEYWDFSKTGDENAQIYLEKCRQDGRIPKFPQFQGYPGYWKLLIDFKMYDNDGVGSPQNVVQPIFDDAVNQKILREYQGGHRSFPVAKDVVRDFAKEYEGKGVRYSDRYQSAEENPDILSMTARVESGNFKASEKVYLGTVSDNIAKQIQSLTGINVDGFKVAIEARQIEHILKDHGKNGISDKSMANPSDIAKMEYAIHNYDDMRPAGKTQAYTHMVNGRNKTADTVLYEKAIGEKSYYVVQAVPDTKAKTLFIVTAFIGKKGYKKEALQLIDAKSPDATANTGSATTSGSIISQPSDSVKNKFSDRDSYAPTFYSHMGKVVDGIKYEKVGAAGVVPYLKGKGVKAEEIKWSGIEAWLEGKKSVTKAELQEFVAGSQLQIEEQMSDKDIELRYDHSTDSYTVIDGTGDVIDTYTYNSELGGYASENDDEVYEYASDLERAMRWAHGTDHAPRHTQYKIDGGENYRELVFVMPNSSYSNNAMRAHWGEDAEGVLAHARIQDITTDDGKKMLFIEEIQSDWHNAGQKDGYKQPGAEEKSVVAQKMMKYADEFHRSRIADVVRERISAVGYEGAGIDMILNYLVDSPDTAKSTLGTLERRGASFTDNEVNEIIDYARGYEELYHNWQEAPGDLTPPDAPFRNNYHEYVLKRLIRMAAEEGYDSIGWTTADIQSERWSTDYAEGYRIEYDQDMPSFMRKYGKKWGAKVEHTTVNGDTDVWSMDIPAAMKNSVLYEGQAMYQDRDPDSVSNRSLLANALDSVAQNDIERAKLAQYKEKIELIHSEERELHELREQIKELSFAKGPKDTAKIRSLQNDATRIANRINTFDRQLLTLEASKPLKAVLEREKSLAYKKAEKKGKEALARYKEKAADTQRELMTRYQESRKKGVESRHKTEMRHKIKDVVSELNQYLLRGTKEHHVPIELQKAVAEALDAVNMDTVGAEERIAKLNEEMMRAKTPEKVQEISRKIDHIKEMGDRMDNKLKALKAAYDKFTDSDDPLIANSHDEVISSKIESVIESVGSTPLRDMTLRQLEDVYDMYRMVLTTVRNANKAFKAAKSESIAVLGNRVMMEVDQLGKKKAFRLKGIDGAERFAWNTYKPVFAFERIGSKTLSRIFNSVRAGEDVWATDVTEAKEFYREQTKKYHYDSWDFGKRYNFRSTSGKDFSLSLDQIMSLYAYSKREQAAEHLRRGGIVFDESTEVTMKTKLGIKAKFNPMEATAYNLSDETLYAIIGKLTPEQKAFVDVMQDYLSTTMGEKGNEVSLVLYGIKLFKEKHYFPLKSAPQFMAIAKEQQQGTVKIKNSGFSKETVQKASNPIVLTPFMDVWSNHVNEMSMYHAFVLPMEDFYRVYNYKTPTSDTMATESVEMFIQNAYGKGATQYIDQLLKDLNGGARTDPRAGVMTTLIGKFKKSAVFASASVVVQQPSAIARALSLVDAKYFVGKMTLRKHSQSWAEVKKYAPVAIIKEMGYFDTNMGMQTTEWMTTKEYSGFTEKAKALFTDSNFRDEVLSKAPALADELSWCYIWEAVKRETHATTKLQPGSEEFLAKAGERFTEVVTKTQVYDSVLARSGLMRSKDTGLKMATAFMAEPTTSLNMIADAIVQGKRGNKGYAAKTIGAVAASMILNSILVSFVYAGRDDDEDKTYAEKYVGTLTEELLDSFNPLTLIPFVKDIVSIAQGYDVERSDMAVVTDLINAWNNLSSENRSVYRKVEDFAGAIASILGLPVKNVMRDARAMHNTINSFINGEQTTGAGIKNAVTEAVTGKEASNGQQLYEAIVNGDTAQIERVKGRFENQTAINTALRKALRENDPRIKQAAEARHNGDIAGYMSIAKEIIGEGNFSQDDVVAAINAEINAMKEPSASTSSDSDKATSIYKVDDYYAALVGRDHATAYAVREDLIKTDVANGKTREDAESDFNSKFASKLREEYEAGTLSDSQAVDMLVNYGGKSYEDASAKVQYWAFKQDYPDINVDDSWISEYYNDGVADAGISIETFVEYRNEVKDITGEGKKERRMAVINSLPITNAQKDALYFAEGWTASRLYEAPWH